MSIKINDKIEFKNKLRWKIISIHKSIAGVIYYKYKVYRKYKNHGWLNYSNCSYVIFKDRWNFLKKMTKKNKNYYYNQ